ncbi:MAG TPA: Ig-like domain repeat protein, partial [Acidimicrobiia bacterium]|nr:Ig-like domain repeat protein [Acidimicrobiia bacterium]
MSPRIRTFVLSFVLASALALPASASANWATIFAAPTSCGVDPGPFSTNAVDTTSSVVPIGWQNSDVAVTLQGTLVDHYEWKLNCGAPSTAGTANIVGDGTWTFTHRAAEAPAGPFTPWVDETVQIDKTVPVNTTATSTAWRTGPFNVPIADLTPDGGSPLHGEWRLDGNPGDPYTTGTAATVPLSAQGTHTLYTSVVDAAGNRADRSQIVRVDNTVPTDDTTAPVGWQQDVAHIVLTGTDAHSGVATIEYQIDSGPVTPVSGNNIPLDITDNGSHTLKTRVLDAVGNDSGWKSQTVQVDSAGPDDATTGVPSGWYNAAPTVSVNVAATDTSGSGVTKIEWNIAEDSRSDTINGATTPPIVISGEGKHTLKVRYTDGMNHVSQWYTHDVWIDTTLPTDTTSAATSWQPLPSLDVTVHGTDAHSGVATVEWKIDGVADSASGDTGTATVAGNGEHTVESRVIDVAGNASAWVSRTVKLDISSPRNTTPVAPTGWISGQYVVLLNGEDDNSGVDSVRWRVDGGAEHVGTRLVETATVAGDQVHTFETRVRDTAGNLSNWRVESVRIDSVKPTNTTIIPGAPVGNGHKIDVDGTDALSGIGGQAWQLDAGAVMTSHQATITGAGPHTLKTRVQDNAGNWSDWRTDSVTVDPALPQEDSDAPLDTTSVPTNWRTGATMITVAADDQGGTGVEYVEWRLDGNAVEQGPSGSTFIVSDDGVHEIETRATDFASNTSAWRSQTLKIDRTLPVDTTSVPASGWINTHSFVLSATDATSGVNEIEYKLDGGVSARVASGFTLNLADGPHTVARRVTDNAGQQTAWKTSTVNVDTSIPANTSATPSTTWVNSAISLPLTGTDTGSGVDHGEWRLGASGTVTSGSAAVVDVDGTSTLQTRVVDKAGNASVWRSDTVKVDLTKPVNTTAAISGGWRKTNFATTVTGSDATSGVQKVEWRVDGAPISATAPVSISADGSHKLETRVTDNAGNVTDWRVDTVAIDKVAPALAVNCGATGVWRRDVVDCSVTADGGVSGMTTLTGTRGGATTDVVNGHFVVDADGAWALSFRAVDGAGNEATGKADVKLDRTAPAAAVTCTPDAALAYTCM